MSPVQRLSAPAETEEIARLHRTIDGLAERIFALTSQRDQARRFAMSLTGDLIRRERGL